MARPKKRESAGGRSRQQDTVVVVDALATRLSSLGRRKWKATELAAALSKASGGLQDEGVRAYIQDNLEQCAQELQDRLRSLQAGAEQEGEPAGQAAAVPPAKRSRQPAGAVAPAPSLASTQGYQQLVAAATAGQQDTAFPATALLLARALPSEQLVAAHVQRLQPATAALAPPEQQAESAVAAAAAALGTCSALATEAGSSADALRMFAPAVAHLSHATQLLAGAQLREASERLQELSQLVRRALASMHVALQRQQLVRSTGQGGSSAICLWRSNQQPAEVPAAEAACSVSASICGLSTKLRLHSVGSQAGSRQQLDALAASAANDLRLLAPFATSGQLSQLATLATEEAQGDNFAARSFLVLYGGACRQEVTGGPDYLARLVAARKAAAVARHLGEEALAARVEEEAASLATSQDFVGWLHEQPPSGIVSAALAASRLGLQGLSAHLVNECSERGLQALLAATQCGVATPAGEAAGAGEGAAEQDAVLDDLLFFADKEGDATMFGREWQAASDDDDEEEDGDEPRTWGVQLDDVPEGDRRLSAEMDSE